jgi:4'-phosphopantetheinyl transferase
MDGRMSRDRKQVFVEQVGELIRASGFGAARAHEASVLVFDTKAFASQVPAASELLDRTERTRAARFRYQSDRATYTLAHAVWRIAIGQCIDAAPEDVPLAATAEGKPHLPGVAFSTSLSHSGSMVALSVSTAATIGVDIEVVPAKIDLDALVPMFCTRREAMDVHGLRPACRARRLMELWTRKEALLKAFGVGFRTDPATTPAPPCELQMPPPDALFAPPCHTRNLGDADEWIAAVATPAAVREARVHLL